MYENFKTKNRSLFFKICGLVIRDKMKKLLMGIITLIFISCGKVDSNCRTQAEMVLRCQADEMQRIGFWQENVDDFIRQFCENLYPTERCW